MAAYYGEQHRGPADNLSTEYYKPVASHQVPDRELLRLEVEDRKLKRRVRFLKLISRITAAVLSATTLAPLVMTLVKFFQTKNIHYNVNGTQRTAWAADTIMWYTYMYTGVAGVSFVLNMAILIAYARGVKQANAVDKINSYWEHLIQFGHIVVWAVSAGIYRYGKQPVNGRFRDLWGWTCSTTADELQVVITDINFGKYCTIQTTSFWSRVVNVATGMLSATIFVFAMLRVRSKKWLQKANRRGGGATEPLRS